MKQTRYVRREPRGNYNRTETLLKVARFYIHPGSNAFADYCRVIESGFWCAQVGGLIKVYRQPITRCGTVSLDGEGRYSLVEDTGASLAGLEWVVEERRL